MTIKKQVLSANCRKSSLLLPDRVVAGLAANGRIKFALSWLQVAEVSRHPPPTSSPSARWWAWFTIRLCAS